MNILVWGLGVSGKSVLALAKHWGMETWAVDDKPELANLVGQDRFLEAKALTINWIQSQGITQIVLSPGVPRSHAIIQECLRQKITIVGELEFAYQKCNLPIYAVTGTNGKSTSVHMLRDALRLLGKHPFLGGNVGIPFSYYYLDPKFSTYDCVVLEVSSFQCESFVAFRPMIAGILNISESHMERYHSLADYASAKILLFKNMTIDQVAILPEKQQQFFYSFLPSITPRAVYYGESELDALDFSQARVVGKHNQENFAFVFSMLSQVFGQSEAREAVQNLIGRFDSIEHRLETCGEVNETIFYNDSKSTNIKSTMTAIDSFADYAPDIERWVIIGGKKRSEDFSFLHAIKDHSQLTGVFCIGESGPQAAKILSNSNKKVYAAQNLEGVFKLLGDEEVFRKQQKRIVILSPAFPSYDQYKNFEERGKHFKSLVQTYIKASQS
jgi:UDP-N-acetylmuramoylalanine--D-glutamate ligase